MKVTVTFELVKFDQNYFQHFSMSYPPIVLHYSQHSTYFQISQAELSAGMGRVLRLRHLIRNFFKKFSLKFQKNFKIIFDIELCFGIPDTRTPIRIDALMAAFLPFCRWTSLAEILCADAAAATTTTRTKFFFEIFL